MFFLGKNRIKLDGSRFLVFDKDKNCFDSRRPAVEDIKFLLGPPAPGRLRTICSMTHTLDFSVSSF